MELYVGIDVRYFARLHHQFGKTDRLDACILAAFAAQRGTDLIPARLDAERDQLKLLVNRRAQLLQMRTAERNRLAQAPNWLRKSIGRTIRALERDVGAIDHEISERVNASARLKAAAAATHQRAGRGSGASQRVARPLTRTGPPQPPRDCCLGRGGTV